MVRSLAAAEESVRHAQRAMLTAELPGLPLASAPALALTGCADEPGWTNGKGKTHTIAGNVSGACATYGS